MSWFICTYGHRYVSGIQVIISSQSWFTQWPIVLQVANQVNPIDVLLPRPIMEKYHDIPLKLSFFLFNDILWWFFDAM